MRLRRGTWTRLLCAVSVVLVASAGVAACTSGTAKPPASSTASSTASSLAGTASVPVVTTPTPTPAPTVPADVPRTGRNLRAGEQPPVMPVLATIHSDAGAKAFVTFFMQTWDWGYATTSGAYMRHYFTPACTECRSFADIFDRSRSKNYYILGGRLVRVRVTADNGAATRSGGESGWTVVFDEIGGAAYDVAGKLIATTAATQNFHTTLYAHWFQGWQISWLVLP